MKQKPNKTIIAESVSDTFKAAARRGLFRGAARHIGRQTVNAAASAGGYIVHGSESVGDGTLHYVVHKKLGGHPHHKKKKHHNVEDYSPHLPVAIGAASGLVAAHYIKKHYGKKKKKHHIVREGIGSAIAGVSDDIATLVISHLSKKKKKKDKNLQQQQQPSAQPMEIQGQPQIAREGFMDSAARIGGKIAKNKFAKGAAAFTAAAAISTPFMNAGQKATEKYLKHRDRLSARQKAKSPEEIPQASQGMQYEGVIDGAARVAARAGQFYVKHKKQIKTAAKFTTGNAISGVVAGATIPVLDRYLAKKEAEQQQAAQAANPGLQSAKIKRGPTKTASIAEATLQKEPPVVLILKRKSIRLFPTGDKVALYKNDKTGISFAVPYDDKEDAVSSNNEVVGAVTEGIGSAAWRSFRRFMARKGMAKGPFTYDTAKDAENIKREKEAAERAYEKLHQSVPGLRHLPKGTGRAAIYGMTGAITAGAAVNMAANSFNKKYLDNPDRTRKVNGRPLYTEAARVNLLTPHMPYANLKGAVKAGAMIGGGAMLAKAGYETGKKYIEMRHTKQKEHEELQKKNLKYVHKLRLRQEEVERLDEFLPALLAAGGEALAAIRAAPIVARAGAALASPIGKAVSKGVGAVGTVGGLVGGAKQVKKMKQKSTNNSGSNTNNTPEGGDVSEATRHVPFKTKVNRYISKDFRKHIAIAAAGALGAKVVDVAYDAYRDRKEVKKAEQEERAKARARKAYAPRKQIITKVEKPHQTIVKKEIKEAKESKYLGYNGIQHILDTKQHGYVHHADGTKTHLDGFTAGMIKNVHDALSNENQEKLRRMVAKDRASFMKIADFSMKQHNKK